MQYEDFDLKIIQTIDDRTYLLYARSAHDGECQAPLDLSRCWDDLIKLRDNLADSVAKPEEALPHATDLGRRLFELAFAGPVGNLFRLADATALRKGDFGLRIRLRLREAPALHPLPWEYLHDGHFLATRTRTPIVRYHERIQPRAPLPVDEPLRVLVMISSPKGVDKLKVDTERERLSSALEDLKKEGRLKIEVIEDGRWQSLDKKLNPGSTAFHLLHFIGHGTEEGLVFTDENGFGVTQSPDRIATMLGSHNTLKLVVLNACEGAHVSSTGSSLAAALIERGVPAVVGMQFAITDDAAVEFSRTFYRALALGDPVDTALVRARVSEIGRTDAESGVEWGTPVLHLNATNVRLFHPRRCDKVRRGLTRLLFQLRRHRRLVGAVLVAVTLGVGLAGSRGCVDGPTAAPMNGSVVRLQNACLLCKCKDMYLDIDANSASDKALIMSSKEDSSTLWAFSQGSDRKINLRNQGDSKFKNYYLDIDADTDALMLNRDWVRGAVWTLMEIEPGVWTLQNAANTKILKNPYLDINGNDCSVMLNSNAPDGSGVRWRLIVVTPPP